MRALPVILCILLPVLLVIALWWAFLYVVRSRFAETDRKVDSLFLEKLIELNGNAS